MIGFPFRKGSRLVSRRDCTSLIGSSSVFHLLAEFFALPPYQLDLIA
jgi:hypothetical protein